MGVWGAGIPLRGGSVAAVCVDAVLSVLVCDRVCVTTCTDRPGGRDLGVYAGSPARAGLGVWGVRVGS